MLDSQTLKLASKLVSRQKKKGAARKRTLLIIFPWLTPRRAGRAAALVLLRRQDLATIIGASLQINVVVAAQIA